MSRKSRGFFSANHVENQLLLEIDMLFQNMNQKQGTVYWIHGVEGRELGIGSVRRICLCGRDKYRRLDRHGNWSAGAQLKRPKSYQGRRHRKYIVIVSVVIGFASWMSVCRTYLNRLLRRSTS